MSRGEQIKNREKGDKSGEELQILLFTLVPLQVHVYMYNSSKWEEVSTDCMTKALLPPHLRRHTERCSH